MRREASSREAVLEQCGAFDEAELGYPFGEDTAVFKVGGKMFAMVALGDPAGSVTLKCDPMESEALRASHSAISPGYHTNKRHWVTVDLGGDRPSGLVADLVRNSYELVVAALPARLRPGAGRPSRQASG